MIGLTSHVREIAEKMAPSAASRRVKMETAASHAVRMAEVHMEVDVVRADLRHLPLLLPLFDQYRSFFAQASEPDRVEEFLRDKLAKQSSVIFVALPVHQSDKNMMMQGGGAHQGGQAGGDGSMSQQEQDLANSLTTTHSVVAGAVQTNMAHGQGSRVAVRLPAYALGFVQVCPSWSSVRLARTWIISDLFVAPAARNKGVASLLLTHARKFASDTGAYSLDIHTSVRSPCTLHQRDTVSCRGLMSHAPSVAFDVLLLFLCPFAVCLSGSQHAHAAHVCTSGLLQAARQRNILARFVKRTTHTHTTTV